MRTKICLALLGLVTTLGLAGTAQAVEVLMRSVNEAGGLLEGETLTFNQAPFQLVATDPTPAAASPSPLNFLNVNSSGLGAPEDGVDPNFDTGEDVRIQLSMSPGGTFQVTSLKLVLNPTQVPDAASALGSMVVHRVKNGVRQAGTQILLNSGTEEAAPTGFLDLAYDVSGLGIFLTVGGIEDSFEVVFDDIPAASVGGTQVVRFIGVTLVPEPSTALLLITGLLGFAALRRS